jgi:putative ABC transport system permease protein
VSRERFFASTVVLGEQVRRLQIRAIGGGYPFYGDFVTVPADAPAQLRKGGDVAIVDQALLDELKIRVGDTLKIRDADFKIIGALVEFPGEPPLTASFQPRAFIPLSAIPEKTGTSANRLDIKLPADANPEGIVRSLKDKFPEARIVFTTAQDRRRGFEMALANLDAFFRLVGFVALFLGAIGVASVVNVYVKQKIATVAILRCLGASARQSFAIYLVQATALGGFGAILGAAVGICGQAALPFLLRDVMPFHVDFFISWVAVASGMVAGFVICLLFTLLPLLAVRRIPPLAALRSAIAESEGLAFDPWRVAIAVLIPVAVAGFAVWQTHNLKFGMAYAAVLGTGFAILAATAKGISWAAKRWFGRPSRISTDLTTGPCFCCFPWGLAPFCASAFSWLAQSFFSRLKDPKAEGGRIFGFRTWTRAKWSPWRRSSPRKALQSSKKFRLCG